jgi:FdrA protein
MAVKALIKRNTYYDSVTLMTASSAIGELPGVEAASITMATALNLELLRDSGLATPEMTDLGPNDLVIVVKATDEAMANSALAEAEARLTRPSSAALSVGAAPRPRTIGATLAADSDIDLVLVSVPGPFAPLEAEEALRAGRHVLLFSDNVPIEEEVRLKQLAGELGLLLMGPDCGTAIINGAGIGFANVVRRGPIGVVGASGTGTQQVTCLIDRLGSGITHAIGTGGRDLRSEVGGMTMRAAIAALGADEETRVIVLVSKPPAEDVAARVLAAAGATGKPTVAIFLGGDINGSAPPGVELVRTLTAAAQRAVALADGRGSSTEAALDSPATIEIERAAQRLSSGQRYVRGVFSGGTLCEEAILLLSERLGPIHSNIPLDPLLQLADPLRSEGHTLVDLGSDEFTVGRPHPMIDPTLRNERVRQEAADPETACLLIDVVLGYGANPDPAGALTPVLQEIRAAAESEGRTAPPVVISLCGTEGDPQRLSLQEAALREAGALVSTSNAAAALAAGAIVEKHVAGA